MQRLLLAAAVVLSPHSKVRCALLWLLTGDEKFEADIHDVECWPHYLLTLQQPF